VRCCRAAPLFVVFGEALLDDAAAVDEQVMQTKSRKGVALAPASSKRDASSGDKRFSRWDVGGMQACSRALAMTFAAASPL